MDFSSSKRLLSKGIQSIFVDKHKVDNCFYTGWLLNNTAHGYGELQCPDEEMKGEFVNGELHG